VDISKKRMCQYYYLYDSSPQLFRKWRNNVFPPSADIHQIVVLTHLRPKLLYIAHDIPAAGHVGVAKTKAFL